MKNVYERLRERLDQMSVGFPATDSQIEIRLLKWLFSEKEAELFLDLSPVLEAPKFVADRLNLDVKEVSEKMEEMEWSKRNVQVQIDSHQKDFRLETRNKDLFILIDTDFDNHIARISISQNYS